jgi:glycerol-3-phosphate dehydrogenase
MVRDLTPLANRTHDLLVVGGGIYGLTIAADASARGLSVALIDRGDFGSGASFNHARTIHGGLRYLQTLDVRRVRESIRERRTLARIAPHALRPLPFVLPLYRSLFKGKTAMRAGLVLDRLLASGRNRGVPSSLHLPPGRVVSRPQAIERFPGLRRQGLIGAAIWHDYVTTEADRLTFSWAIAAAEHGAILANYVEASAPLLREGRVVGVRALDRVSGREMDVAAALTINAAGGGFDARLAGLGRFQPGPRLKALNLVTRREAGDEALGGRSSSGRYLFLVPWRNRAIFSTWESPAACSPEEGTPRDDEVARFIVELNEAFPSLDLETADVTLVHRGVVPAVADEHGSVSLEGHERVHDHAGDGVEGLVTVAGAKYTTARATAERVVDLALRKLRRDMVACRTALVPLPGGDLGDMVTAIADARREYDARLPSDTVPHLLAAYGSRFRRVLDVAGERPEWRARVAEESPVIGAELVWAVREEMAVTLADAVIRRTPLGAVGYPGDAAVERAADLVGSELSWSGQKKREEIDSLRTFYNLPLKVLETR